MGLIFGGGRGESFGVETEDELQVLFQETAGLDSLMNGPEWAGFLAGYRASDDAVFKSAGKLNSKDSGHGYPVETFMHREMPFQVDRFEKLL